MSSCIIKLTNSLTIALPLLFVVKTNNDVHTNFCLRIKMSIADAAFKTTSAVLGLTTVVAGVWLGASMVRGFMFHRQVCCEGCCEVSCEVRQRNVMCSFPYITITNTILSVTFESAARNEA